MLYTYIIKILTILGTWTIKTPKTLLLTVPNVYKLLLFPLSEYENGGTYTTRVGEPPSQNSNPYFVGDKLRFESIRPE